jgi:AcrR family transcriptional regulator
LAQKWRNCVILCYVNKNEEAEMKTYYTDTKSKLSAALWKLMETDNLENITITQICQEAKIGRRSFYRHFQTKRNVIEYGIRQKSEEFFEFNAGCKSMETMIENFFKFFKKQKRYIRLIQKNYLTLELYNIVQSGELFKEELDIYMQRTMIPGHLREYVANVIAAMQTSLLITWADHNFSEDWVEIAGFELNLFSEMAE